jgi:hypothetical protein
LNITFRNFNAYLSKDKYETSIVYSSLIGESFIRRLSTNIIDKNGDIIFKSTDGDGDFYEYNKDNSLFNKEDFTKKHFNKFILIDTNHFEHKVNPSTLINISREYLKKEYNDKSKTIDIICELFFKSYNDYEQKIKK